MKRKRNNLAFAFVFMLTLPATLVFSSCGKHKHSFSKDWTTTETEHWHACTGKECEEKKDLGNHDFTWTTKTEAGVHIDKVEAGKCKVCDYETTRTITGTATHSYDTTKWVYDETNHWHASNCNDLAPAHDVMKIDEANHSGEWTTKVEPNYGVDKVIERDCEVCGYHEEKTLEGSKLAPKNRELTANIPELTYNGEPQPVDPYLTMTNNVGGLTVEYRKKGDNLFTNTVPTNAGTYEYVAKLNGTDEWLEASTFGEYTINRKTIHISDGPYTINYVENPANNVLELTTGTIGTNNVTFCVYAKYNVIGRASIPTSEIFIRSSGSINYNANYQVAIEGKDSFELVVLDASPLYCGIQDVLTLPGQSTPIITTKIAKGTVKVNDKLFVNDIHKEITVVAIEKNRVSLNSATIGDEVGLKVSGVTKAELSRGYVISALNTVKNYDVFKAKITLSTKADGGRNTPIASGYNPTLSFTDTFGYFSGKFTLPEGVEMMMPGTTEENVTITLNMPKPLIPNAKFNIYEGGKTIGRGEITSLHEHNDLYLKTGVCEACNLNRQTEATLVDFKFTSTNNTYYANEYKYYSLRMLTAHAINQTNYYDFEISDTTNFEFNVFTTSGGELTLIDGKSYNPIRALTVVMRVKAKQASTTGDCTTTITRRLVTISRPR